MQTASVKHTLDIRHVPVAERCLKISTAFETLVPRNSFVLITDSDPESHHCHLLAELGERVQWEILERSPDVWRILITRNF